MMSLFFWVWINGHSLHPFFAQFWSLVGNGSYFIIFTFQYDLQLFYLISNWRLIQTWYLYWKFYICIYFFLHENGTIIPCGQNSGLLTVSKSSKSLPTSEDLLRPSSFNISFTCVSISGNLGGFSAGFLLFVKYLFSLHKANPFDKTIEGHCICLNLPSVFVGYVCMQAFCTFRRT